MEPNPNVLTEALADIGRALASKNLEEPANAEALLDIILWIATIILACVFTLRNLEGALTMCYMAFGFTFISFTWLIFHYTVLRTTRRR